MTSDEKRDYIYKTLKNEIEKERLTLKIRAPKKIKKVTFFYVKEIPVANNDAADNLPVEVISPAPSTSINTPLINFSSNLFDVTMPVQETVSHDDLPEEINDINKETASEAAISEKIASGPADGMSKSEATASEPADGMSKKEYKEFLKEKKREEKYYNRVRKDIHKRGYDTTLLEQFENIEEVYDLTNEEIDQIRAAGFINEDGFYSFMPPSDYAEIKRESTSTRTLLIICGGILACVVIILFSMRSLFQVL